VAIRSLWRQEGTENVLLTVAVYECASIKACHDQLIETLGELESAVVERHTGKNKIGDVSFGLSDTMVLFARANLVVWIRNAGRTVVKVGAIARAFDKLLERRLDSERKR
jgi:hypothetical protein